ncbi:MAG TPA: extracellular solute-binding protein [Bdellovibrionales bacterium]|nr:extracellular solute-binding protein [Bdellovibrionales bacterium]
MKLIIAVLAFVSVAAHAADLVLLSDRPRDRLQSVMDGFTAETGVKVQLVSAPFADLKTRLEAGEPADIVILKDALAMGEAQISGFLQPMSAQNLAANVPAILKDPAGEWIGLTYRVRTIAYGADAEGVGPFANYADLAAPEWKGQLCMRDAKDYVPALAAWMIARFGAAEAERLLLGWKANLAGGAFTGNDIASLDEISQGRCNLSVVNHYYLARKKAAQPHFPVELVSADSAQDGAHVNSMTAAIGKNSAALPNANAFLAYALSNEGQARLVSPPSFEFPASLDAEPVDVVKNFGPLKPTTVLLSEVMKQGAAARTLLEKVEWAR